jgi:hypothetical protein
MQLWNVETAAPLRIYTGHVDAVLSLLFSSVRPDEILSGSGDQSLHMWHIEEHCQQADQPLPLVYVDDDEDTTAQSAMKHKKHHKPRLNRSEREQKKAAKVGELYSELSRVPLRFTKGFAK